MSRPPRTQHHEQKPRRNQLRKRRLCIATHSKASEQQARSPQSSWCLVTLGASVQPRQPASQTTNANVSFRSPSGVVPTFEPFHPLSSSHGVPTKQNRAVGEEESEAILIHFFRTPHLYYVITALDRRMDGLNGRQPPRRAIWSRDCFVLLSTPLHLLLSCNDE